MPLGACRLHARVRRQAHRNLGHGPGMWLLYLRNELATPDRHSGPILSEDVKFDVVSLSCHKLGRRSRARSVRRHLPVPHAGFEPHFRLSDPPNKLGCSSHDVSYF